MTHIRRWKWWALSRRRARTSRYGVRKLGSGAARRRRARRVAVQDASGAVSWGAYLQIERFTSGTSALLQVAGAEHKRWEKGMPNMQGSGVNAAAGIRKSSMLQKDQCPAPSRAFLAVDSVHQAFR